MKIIYKSPNEIAMETIEKFFINSSGNIDTAECMKQFYAMYKDEIRRKVNKVFDFTLSEHYNRLISTYSECVKGINKQALYISISIEYNKTFKNTFLYFIYHYTYGDKRINKTKKYPIGEIEIINDKENE